jgi:hypothetical protein
VTRRAALAGAVPAVVVLVGGAVWCFTPAPSPPPGGCGAALNTCPDYAPSWRASCPAGARCLTIHNGCAAPVVLSYAVGCDGDGDPGAPQCSCTVGPTLDVGGVAAFVVTDGDYASCLPSWSPPCLTAGLAIVPGYTANGCQGTRIEFTAGNTADPYGRFDSYDLDVEKGFSVPVSYGPALTCATDHAGHDCRPLACGSSSCPDAFLTPTTGGCADGRSPAVGCDDTFSDGAGYAVELCPEPLPASCQDAIPCAG